MKTPGRLSGVCCAGAVPSIPASAGDMITLVAKPVAFAAAVSAHFSFSAVIRILPAHIGNISANVSAMVQMFPVRRCLVEKLPSLSFPNSSSSYSSAVNPCSVLLCDIFEPCLSSVVFLKSFRYCVKQMFYAMCALFLA